MDDIFRTLAVFGPGALCMVAWITAAGLLGLVAGRRGYHPVVWFVFGLIASPLAAAFLLLLITPLNRRPPGAA
jgi:hypothetical protein